MKKYPIMAGIVLLTFISYWNVRHNSLINYDDVKYLIENEPVRSGLGFSSILWAFTATYDANWFPLTWLSHMLDMTLFGSNPLAHHLVNLLYHCANALLLQTLLFKLSKRLICSSVVALIFAVHPLHVESVAWVAERKDVLSTFFFLLTILTYVRYVAFKTRSAYLSVTFLYVCGLASKPMLVTLPYILLLLDWGPLARLKPTADRTEHTFRIFLILIREKLPLILLSTASCILTYIVQRNGGTVRDQSFPPLAENTLHAVHNYSTYLSKIFYPVDLSVMYPYRQAIPPLEWVCSFIIFLTLSLLALYLRNNKPYIALGWMWFVITLVPVIGIVRIGAHSVADRYTYIPSIGIFIIIVWGVADLLQKSRYARHLSTILTSVITVILVSLTWKQTTYWKDTVTLFEHAVTVTRDNWVAHANLGSELVKYNRTEQAFSHLREAIRINPDNSDSYYNLALVLNIRNDITGAILALQNAIRITPDYEKAYFVLGRLYFIIGERDAANVTLNALQQINPEMGRSLAQTYTLIEQTMRATLPHR